ncbi:hypothetical protein Q4561_09905 [Alteromonas sp. 1_MG-2023]|uniref:hypothetical protein n=1 Tax=Alteromonas sp. 1_MG-2023 TaxID=3062669 RepID=UPI0026E217C8|nr:hypothetical protein [Alteromonas sp. 1_MG-2023]MDO6567372.1 hypothetical protein [Alteromonas sp. 1_MG-2023]
MRRFASFFLITSLFSHGVLADTSNDLEFSGFARVVGGYLSTDEAKYEGYDNSFSVSQKSLAAVQADYTFNDYFSMSGQLLWHSDESRQSGVEWLYLTYQPNASWQFNIGRLRTPLLKFSDVIDVGFAYPWLNAPQQLYSGYLFSQYEGANARYLGYYNEVTFSVELYWGNFDDEILSNGTSSDVEVDGMFGGVIETSYRGFQFRVATSFANDTAVELDELQPLIQGLRAAGFGDTADTLDINGASSSYLLGVGYDSLNWFVTAEIIKVESEIDVLAAIDSSYITFGYYFDEILLHATIASSRQSLNEIDNPIPIGFSPELDALYFAVEEVNSYFPTDDLDSLTLGARWDFRTNLAFKTEVSFLKGKEGKTSFFELDVNNTEFDRRATLYQLGIEWVF